jgi:hypothetical protein
MAEDSDRITDVRPKLRRRACGGWLAICPSGEGLSFGITALTEQEARDKFRFAFGRWLEILNTKTLGVPR